MAKCETCGAELQVGAWPFCPHGPYRGTAIGDEIDEWNEMVADQPVHFTSKTEKRKYLKAHGLLEFVRWSGPNDKHVSRWASVDLDAATALVSRMGAPAEDPETICETATFEVTPL